MTGRAAMDPAFRIGTSGFIYDHWRGRYYSAGDRGRELERYARDFDVVELNVTFYRLPAASTFRGWASRVPVGFQFAVKASRYLTHTRRLREPRPAVELLLERATLLGDHLGPVLVQLPPDMPPDLDALEETLDAFPAGIRVAVEPRHPGWFTDELRHVLERHRAALCLADRRGPITPAWHTTDWSYVRFHAGRGSPRSCYTQAALRRWSERLAEQSTPRSGVVFFNNDHGGCALRDARVLACELTARGLPVSRIPTTPADVVAADAP